MKKNIVILFLFFTYAVFGQKIITKRYQSEILKKPRNVKISLPKDYEKDSITNFPLVIVLDAGSLFNIVVGNSNLPTISDEAPRQIIVGIEMINTQYKDVGYIKETGKLTGDNYNFLRFIREELLVDIEANYKTSSFLTIVGEGLSGNLITHFLKEEYPVFNSYICINPTLSIDFINHIDLLSLPRYEKLDNTFYFYLSGSPFNNKQKSNRILQFHTFLSSLDIANFHYKYDDFEQSQSSVSAVGEAVPRALTKTFETYKKINKEEYLKNIKNLSPEDAILYLKNKYLDIEYLFGTNIGIRIEDIYAIESIIIDQDNGKYLKGFGKMILKLFPSSPLGDYYLGLYYEMGKKYKKALKYYHKGYGKFDLSNPDADKFYKNIERVNGMN